MATLHAPTVHYYLPTVHYYLQQSLISQVRRNLHDFQLEIISLEQRQTSGEITLGGWGECTRSLLHRLGAYWGTGGAGHEWAAYYEVWLDKKNVIGRSQMMAAMAEFDGMFDKLLERCSVAPS